MSTTTTSTKIRSPKLLLKTLSNTATPVITTAAISFSSSTIATGSFYLPVPIKPKNNRRNHQKRLRKPQSFDTYLHSDSSISSSTATTPCGYLTRTSSLSSSYSSTISLVESEYSEDLYGKGNHFSTASMPYRLRRGSSANKVRFADASDDGSSFMSSSSGSGADECDWDIHDLEELDDEVEEEYIYVANPHHFYNDHKKNDST